MASSEVDLFQHNKAQIDYKANGLLPLSAPSPPHTPHPHLCFHQSQFSYPLHLYFHQLFLFTPPSTALFQGIPTLSASSNGLPLFHGGNVPVLILHIFLGSLVRPQAASHTRMMVLSSLGFRPADNLVNICPFALCKLVCFLELLSSNTHIRGHLAIKARGSSIHILSMATMFSIAKLAYLATQFALRWNIPHVRLVHVHRVSLPLLQTGQPTIFQIPVPPQATDLLIFQHPFWLACDRNQVVAALFHIYLSCKCATIFELYTFFNTCLSLLNLVSFGTACSRSCIE